MPTCLEDRPYRRGQTVTQALLSIVLLTFLWGCPSSEHRLTGTWTNELDGGQLTFNNGNITWYGDQGTYTQGEREWFVHYRYDAGWIDAQLSEDRYFGYDFHAGDNLLTLWEVRNGQGYTHHFTKNNSGISLSDPAGWNLSMEGLGKLPQVDHVMAGSTKTFLLAGRYAYNPLPRDPPDIRTTAHLFVSNGGAWQELPQDIGGESWENRMLAVSGQHVALINSRTGELLASNDEGQTFSTYREDLPPWVSADDESEEYPASFYSDQFGGNIAIVGEDLFLSEPWGPDGDGHEDEDCETCDEEPSSTRIYRLENFATANRGTWTTIATFEGRPFPFDESDEWAQGIVSIGSDLGLVHAGKFFRSSDRGESWQELSEGLPLVPGAHFVVQGSNLLLESGEHNDDDLQYVLEAGATQWRELGLRDFRVNCATDTTLYGTLKSDENNWPWSWGRSQIYKSDDLGETVVPVGTTFEHPRQQRLRALCGHNGRVFADTRLDDHPHPPPATTLFEAVHP